MSAPPRASLDPRAWLVWGLAASLPPLLGRNPLGLGTTLVAALGVRAAWATVAPRTASWRGLLRLAVVFAAIGIVFNLLTAHVGDRVLARLPGTMPLVGGAVTLNAAVYGLLSGLALLTLVVIGTTLGAVLDWPAMVRLLPARLTPVAVAGSVAFAFVPQTAAAFRDIREAQAARGYRPRGARDLVPLLVPLLTGGLERAITLAEALESRGFGTPLGPPARSPAWRGALSAGSLAGGATGGYLLASGRPLPAVVLLVGAAAGLIVATRETGRGRVGRTRYRSVSWTRADTFVAVAAGAAAAVTLLTLLADPAALAYEPYPSLTAPHVSLVLLAALGLLLAPALVVPALAPGADEAWDGRPS